jgi:ABC-type spermidine/putrescine transport system permease subunit II
MFGGSFWITTLVAFGIAMVVIRLGIFDSVAYKFGTQRSLTTRAWALFLTIISVSIIMGLGLLVEAITGL